MHAYIIQILVLTDAQTPFLGTPLVPLSIRKRPGLIPMRVSIAELVCRRLLASRAWPRLDFLLIVRRARDGTSRLRLFLCASLSAARRQLVAQTEAMTDARQGALR